jgi:hypothetical protein
MRIQKLDRYEVDSALWKRLKAHIEEEIRIQRAKNDGDQEVVETAKIRGRIAQLKALLALGEIQSPAQVTDDSK